MKVGMLWLDDDKSLSFEDKIRRAAEYYTDKYGGVPDCCLVSTAMLSEERRIGRIEVRPARNILPNHFWLGMKAV